MFELPATLDAVEEHLPELEPWLKWCTIEPDHVRLPRGCWVTSDRGAGQGEPEGPLKAALTIGQAVRRARADLGSAGVLCPEPGGGKSTMGSWWWRSKALGHKAKSSVKACIPEDEAEACCGWRTDYIDDKCEVISQEVAASKVLGVGPDSKLGVQFAEVVAKVVELH